jgi:hypothetical protein
MSEYLEPCFLCNLEKKSLILQGFEVQPLGRPARSQSVIVRITPETLYPNILLGLNSSRFTICNKCLRNSQRQNLRGLEKSSESAQEWELASCI